MVRSSESWNLIRQQSASTVRLKGKNTMCAVYCRYLNSNYPSRIEKKMISKFLNREKLHFYFYNQVGIPTKENVLCSSVLS